MLLVNNPLLTKPEDIFSIQNCICPNRTRNIFFKKTMLYWCTFSVCITIKSNPAKEYLTLTFWPLISAQKSLWMVNILCEAKLNMFVIFDSTTIYHTKSMFIFFILNAPWNKLQTWTIYYGIMTAQILEEVLLFEGALFCIPSGSSPALTGARKGFSACVEIASEAK